MCRLLGIVSTRRAALSELLGEDLDAFLRLACVHNDGWGLAYTDATDAVAQVKEPVGAETSTRFRPLVDCSITDAAILHLRLASPDMAVQERNTHPFGDSLLAFAHNGAFSPKEVLDGQISRTGWPRWPGTPTASASTRPCAAGWTRARSRARPWPGPPPTSTRGRTSSSASTA